MLKFIIISVITFVYVVCFPGSVMAGCPEADLNRDCLVDFLDVRILAENWLVSPESPADMNADQQVDMLDFAFLAAQWSQQGIPLAINELMASNSSCIRDPQGQYDDWIEIHNFGSAAIDIGGMYLTDNLSLPNKWRIPTNNPSVTTIAADGYLLIWADDDTTDSGLHANFKLSAAGEEIGLFDKDGLTPIDSIRRSEPRVQKKTFCTPYMRSRRVKNL